jgi:hypothetical protein
MRHTNDGALRLDAILTHQDVSRSHQATGRGNGVGIMLMPGDFAQTVRPHLEAVLGPGELLESVVATTQQKTFSGGLHALGVTDRRLLVMALDRRSQPKGEVRSITADTLVSADVDGAGGGWWTPSAILDATAATLTLRTTDGDKLKDVDERQWAARRPGWRGSPAGWRAGPHGIEPRSRAGPNHPDPAVPFPLRAQLEHL